MLMFTQKYVFADGMEGWDTVMNMTNVQHMCDWISAISNNYDPAFFGPSTLIDADKCGYVYIHLRSSHIEGGVSFDCAKLYWSTVDKPECEEASMSFEVAVDGEWHEYLLFVAGNNNWRRRITRLRFDPGQQPNVKTDIKEISIVPNGGMAAFHSKWVNLPNLFILGAARCGTTSLYYYLRQHPDILMSKVKEPTFWCQKGLQVVDDPVTYCGLFETVRKPIYKGEASHGYLSDPGSFRVLSSVFPEAKFIVIFRHPADRAYSLYHFMRKVGGENISTFEKALEAEEKRTKSMEGKNGFRATTYNHLYFKSGLFGEQIERYLSVFRRDQFYFLKLDELRRDAKRELRKIFAFLQIRADVVCDTPALNDGRKTARYPGVEHWLNKLVNPSYNGEVQKMKYLIKIVNIVRSYNRMDTPPMKVRTKVDLGNRYREDIGLLRELTDIEL